MTQRLERLVNASKDSESDKVSEPENKSLMWLLSTTWALPIVVEPVAVSLQVGDGWIVPLIMGSLLVIVVLLIITLLIALLSRR